MADLEKVIKGLECHRERTVCVNEEGEVCPYFSYKDCHRRLTDDALELLKEREPKAIEYHDNHFTRLPVAHCPNCMRYARQFYSSVEEETHYCPWCGQAVKWDEPPKERNNDEQ